MHNLEGVTDRVVLALQRSETREDLVVDALDEDDSLEGVVVLHDLVVLVPGGHGILGLQGAALCRRAEPGSFVDSGLVEFTNRLVVTEQRSRVRYVPDEAVDLDIRFFALLSSPVGEELPEADYTWDTCDGNPCVDVALPTGTWSFYFIWEGARWILDDVVAP